MPIMNKYIRGLGEGKAMYLLFVKAETLTNAGIPVRSVLTSYYKSPHFLHRKHDLYNKYTGPDFFAQKVSKACTANYFVD